MSSKEELYSNLAERMTRLNRELVRFTRQAESTQQVISKASEVTTLYSTLYCVSKSLFMHRFKNTTPLAELTSKTERQ